MIDGTSCEHYTAAMGGVIAFTKALSGEFARYTITVIAIVPNKMETDMLGVTLDIKSRNGLLEKIPVGRLDMPEEIAGLAVYLSSDNAGYITANRSSPLEGTDSCERFRHVHTGCDFTVFGENSAP
ncbi:MAG: SDR family oxidoreductase [Spirochaetes bacterium]|nr:SDR family oxidoreductase [Spirochaetota bacterium]